MQGPFSAGVPGPARLHVGLYRNLRSPTRLTPLDGLKPAPSSTISFLRSPASNPSKSSELTHKSRLLCLPRLLMKSEYRYPQIPSSLNCSTPVIPQSDAMRGGVSAGWKSKHPPLLTRRPPNRTKKGTKHGGPHPAERGNRVHLRLCLPRLLSQDSLIISLLRARLTAPHPSSPHPAPAQTQLLAGKISLGASAVFDVAHTVQSH